TPAARERAGVRSLRGYGPGGGQARVKREYAIVDVFTERALAGNPLAVFRDGSGIGAGTMQAIAKELHLSGTTFVLPPGAKEADRRVRIFTPDNELPFAAHPTIGTAYILADGK